MTTWETIHSDPYQSVRRIRVPGGWLYQVEAMTVSEPMVVGEPPIHHTGWSHPVFVPLAPEVTP